MTVRSRGVNPSHPPVDGLDAVAVSLLWDVLEPLAQLQHEGVANWATTVLSALLERHAKLTAAMLDRPVVVERVLDRPPTTLAGLTLAERVFLKEHFAELAGASALAAVTEWCQRLVELVDWTGMRERAVADAMLAKLRGEPSDADLTGIPPWSEVSRGDE